MQTEVYKVEGTDSDGWYISCLCWSEKTAKEIIDEYKESDPGASNFRIIKVYIY